MWTMLMLNTKQTAPHLVHCQDPAQTTEKQDTEELIAPLFLQDTPPQECPLNLVGLGNKRLTLPLGPLFLMKPSIPQKPAGVSV